MLFKIRVGEEQADDVSLHSNAPTTNQSWWQQDRGKSEFIVTGGQYYDGEVEQEVTSSPQW